MTDAVAHCEVLLRAYSKKRDKDGDWIQVAFQLHPQDVPKLLNDAALGTRFMLALAEIGDDEQPVSAKPEKPKRQFPDKSPTEQAGAACVDPEFQKWVGTLGWMVEEAGAAACVRRECGVDSRRSLNINPEAAKRWHDLYARFQHETGRVAEERR